MSIHSKFLIHWTGHDFHGPSDKITDSIRGQYVERLRDDCIKGLFMRIGEETIHGSNHSFLKASIARVCFTEIRLSQAAKHASRYGKLGIGFHRDFLLERQGNPALYVQSGDNGLLIKNLEIVREYLEGREEEKLRRLEVVLGYVKNMSYPNSPDLEFYEEMEWRIVHLDDLMGRYINMEDSIRHFYRLKVKPNDIKIIVFPDQKTKEMAVRKPEIADFFSWVFPMMTTVEDCESF